MAGYVFEVDDWKHRWVRMTQATFDNHKLKHLEVPDYVEEAKQTIGDPDVVLEGDDGSVYLCRYKLGRPPFSKCWLVVVIHYKASGGIVATYFFCGSLPSKRLVELRQQQIPDNSFQQPHGGST